MKELQCAATRAQLVAYAEGELDAAQRGAVQRHVATCPNCDLELQEIEALRGALGGERVPDPGAVFWEKFPDQVLQAYHAENAAASRSSLSMRATEIFTRIYALLVSGPGLSAAAALVLAVGVALYFKGETSSVSGIAAFQTQIQGGKDLESLAQSGVIGLPRYNQYGFSSPGKINFFRIGHAYAESVAYAAGGDAETARLRLMAITESLGNAPDSLTALARGSPSLPNLTALEPELARIAASNGGTTLFRAGGWLVNLALAVAARDHAAMQVAAPEILRLRHELEANTAAPGAIRDLRSLGELLAGGKLSDRDFVLAARLIRDVQLILM